MVMVGFGWSWFIFVCGWPSSSVGGRLHVLGGHGGEVEVGCHWHQVSCCGCR